MSVKGTSILRERNQKKVIEYVRKNEPCSRLEIAAALEVSKNTISLIVDQLIKDKVIKESGSLEKQGAGRPRIMLSLLENAYLSLGFLLGKNRIDYCIVNFRFQTVEEGGRKLEPNHNLIEELIKLSKELIKKHPKIYGIGVGVPGLVDPNSGYVYHSANLEWRDVPLKRELEKEFNHKISIFNSVKVAALRAIDEMRGGDFKSAFYIRIGEGVGGAFIIGNQVYNGNSWTAGEIGHISVDPLGPECSCGQKGCLEKLISMNTFREFLQNNNPEVKVKHSQKEWMDWVKSNLTAAKESSQYGEYLGRAIVHVIHLMNPQTVIVDSPYNTFENFKNKTIAAVKVNTLPFPLLKTNIAFTEHAFSPAKGAAISILLQLEYHND
ncbi:putative NBD/HSP70 family sugar kinase [Cytobacillus oceanisediminis]|uniref:Putative NBD/HSP70 family sugar kinase n=1 Tax=Cytobacillus oceanisediminis TaxID=665099 RepID=A0A2V2ZX39_9BACI|nr:ROK family transcriptional regulator [Cytobacillus oceanisediminis]PWW28250.1 putative NBD/HSP70 family sugar kinase [Cytobacillus oceanisediminis]